MTKPGTIAALLLNLGQRLDVNDPTVMLRPASIAFKAHIATPLNDGRELRIGRTGHMVVWVGKPGAWEMGPTLRLTIPQRITAALWVRRVLSEGARVDQETILNELHGIVDASK